MVRWRGSFDAEVMFRTSAAVLIRPGAELRGGRHAGAVGRPRAGRQRGGIPLAREVVDEIAEVARRDRRVRDLQPPPDLRIQAVERCGGRLAQQPHDRLVAGRRLQGEENWGGKRPSWEERRRGPGSTRQPSSRPARSRRRPAAAASARRCERRGSGSPWTLRPGAGRRMHRDLLDAVRASPPGRAARRLARRQSRSGLRRCGGGGLHTRAV